MEVEYRSGNKAMREYVKRLEEENAGLAKECVELCEERDRLQKAYQLRKALEQVVRADVLQAHERIAELEAENRRLLDDDGRNLSRALRAEAELKHFKDYYKNQLPFIIEASPRVKKLEAERDFLVHTLREIIYVQAGVRHYGDIGSAGMIAQAALDKLTKANNGL